MSGDVVFEKLKTFFEENPLSAEAADSIKDGREIEFIVNIADSTENYTFTKTKGKNTLIKGKASKADLRFELSSEAVDELVGKTFSSVGQVGLHIFEKMLSNDPKQKIHAKVQAGFLGLMTGGYLGVLTAGGSEVTKYLATKGLGNIGKIKDTISKLKG